MNRRHGSKSDILREAQDVADNYIRSALLTPRRRWRDVPPAVYALAGAVLAGAVWLLLHLTHVI